MVGEVILELIRKVPTTLAILALGWALHETLVAGVDGTLRMTLVAAIAGLGGFYLRDVLHRRAPRHKGES